MVAGRALVVCGALLLGTAACGGDDDDGGAGDGSDAPSDPSAAADGTEPATTDADVPAAECASDEGDPSRTITIRVDDEVGGFGSIGSQVPSGITAGRVRVVVEADEENEGPITVTLQSEGTTERIAGVEPGVECGVDLRLAAGDYVATSDVNDGDTEFTVAPR